MDTMTALATEVLQSRQRRCGNCVSWKPDPYSPGGYGECRNGETWGAYAEDGPSWKADHFCALFTPKP